MINSIINSKIAKDFIFSIDNDEARVKHSKSHNIEILINDESDKFFKTF